LNKEFENLASHYLSSTEIAENPDLWEVKIWF